MLIAGPATGILAGGGFGMFQLLNGLQRAARDRIIRARVAVPGRERPTILRGKDMKRIVLANTDEELTLSMPYHSGKVRLPDERRVVTLTGADALRAAATVLPAVNVKGANREQVSDAVRLMDATPDVIEMFKTATRLPMPSRGHRHQDISSGDLLTVMRTRRWREVARPRLGSGEVFVDRLPQSVRLALEMAAHEDIERRAMEGELAMLERAWREAEEIASISDAMFLPAGVEERFEAFKQSE